MYMYIYTLFGTYTHIFHVRIRTFVCMCVYKHILSVYTRPCARIHACKTTNTDIQMRVYVRFTFDVYTHQKTRIQTL